ncbi:EAL domain-containing protein [Halomonas sp. TD01]|uniref:bifunctional diguanylate cyclase/phosphodiesterase n=1 Tax=Halomonas sp. TD01 TaxID=999141 RepID=UPI000214F9E1|nr:EAL domain-containing protein [Halomonas sp. TD01]EGP18190.1 diguanylate cyclase/phosphodiesterase [Halomonas sp. TD01]CAH1044350.1 diguanylate cyclase/phosphodiesterase (GGDEF & EAL domains) with PAS/PAC sensor(s) [Halomonas sp. TD01]
MRFRTRLMLVLLAVVIISQIATGAAFLHATQNDALMKGNQRLEVGARVLHQLLDIRGEQLRSNVAILADDFGFKSAVATKDTATLYSVLANHGDRAQADMVMLSDLAGNVLASSHHEQGSTMPFPELFGRAQQNGHGVGVVIGNGEPYEFVLMPVRAPNLIGWVGMGFLIDEEVVQEINALTGLDISIVTYDASGDVGYLASSHQEQLAKRLMSGHGDKLMGGAYTTHSQMSDNNNYLSYASELLESPEYQSYALLQLSRNELLGAYQHLKWQLIGIVTLMLLLTLAVAMWSARSISKPLIALALAAKRIGQGEHVGRIPGAAAVAETDLLATTLLSMQEDIAKREATLHHQSRHDMLTDLPNRVSALEDIFKRIQKGQPFSLLRFAINDFRDINDTFGYALGDHLLVTLAQRMQQLPAPVSKAYRLDGDELMLLIERPYCDTSTRTELMSRLNQPINLDKSPIVPSISAGEVNYPAHGITPQLLLRRSDIALDKARRHRHSHESYVEGQEEQHLRQLMLIRDLQEAVKNSELWMAYQPKVDTHSGQVCQFEALMRWRHPTLGFVPPDEFIGLAERSGNIGLLSNWMLAHVCEQLHRWKCADNHLSVAVNLSASDLIDSTLPKRISGLLHRFNLTPDQLALEVTESAVMQDVDAATETLLALSQQGLKIAIDDYGTGYSSLAQIKRLPVDELKIDKSFVLKLDTQEEDLTIVRSTIEMAHNLGLKTVAEGVENSATAELLCKLQCDYLQGYWIAKPMPADDVLNWLADTPSLVLPSLATR